MPRIPSSACAGLLLLTALFVATGCDDPNAPPDVVPTLAQLEAGERHTCALSSTGEVYCWGSNASGQLGDGTLQTGRTPVRVVTDARFVDLAAGSAHTCGLTEAGATWCWGSNTTGQTGRPLSLDPQTLPALAEGLPAFTRLVAGHGETCGITSARSAVCWGGSQGTSQVQGPPRTYGLDLTDLSVGGMVSASGKSGWHRCGVRAGGAVVCWGNNVVGQVGDGSQEDTRADPTPVDLSRAARIVTAGTGHTCGLFGTQPYCWGSNSGGQLGSGSAGPGAVRRSPTPVVTTEAFEALVAGGRHTCGLSAGRAMCWGANDYGQTGAGSPGAAQERPAAVAGGMRFVALTAGDAHTCGVAEDGHAYCWGYNYSHQLGTGTGDRAVPTRVQLDLAATGS